MYTVEKATPKKYDRQLGTNLHIELGGHIKKVLELCERVGKSNRSGFTVRLGNECVMRLFGNVYHDQIMVVIRAKLMRVCHLYLLQEIIEMVINDSYGHG